MIENDDYFSYYINSLTNNLLIDANYDICLLHEQIDYDLLNDLEGAVLRGTFSTAMNSQYYWTNIYSTNFDGDIQALIIADVGGFMAGTYGWAIKEIYHGTYSDDVGACLEAGAWGAGTGSGGRLLRGAGSWVVRHWM